MPLRITSDLAISSIIKTSICVGGRETEYCSSVLYVSNIIYDVVAGQRRGSFHYLFASDFVSPIQPKLELISMNETLCCNATRFLG